LVLEPGDVGLGHRKHVPFPKPIGTIMADNPEARPAQALPVPVIASTGREVFQSHEELIWPEKIVCGHPEHDDAAVAAN